MKRFGSAATVSLALLALFALARPAAAGEQVPFKGTLDGDVTHTAVDPHTDYVVVEATGTASHLGQFTLTVPHLVNTTTRTAAGTYEFTAANGDTLTGEFTGASTPTAVPGVISIVEHVTITGGTGRFADATGTFTIHRVLDQNSGVSSGSFEGTINPSR